MNERIAADYDVSRARQAEHSPRPSADSERPGVTATFGAAGYPRDRAVLVDDSLVDSDMGVVRSHGVSRSRICAK